MGVLPLKKLLLSRGPHETVRATLGEGRCLASGWGRKQANLVDKALLSRIPQTPSFPGSFDAERDKNPSSPHLFARQ